MKKRVEHKRASIFQRMLEDKNVIRKCIQGKGGYKTNCKRTWYQVFNSIMKSWKTVNGTIHLWLNME